MKSLSLSLAVLGAVALSAQSNAIDLKYIGLDLTNTLTSKITVNGGSAFTVQTGRLKFTDGSNTILTYCVDATSTLNGNTHPYSASTIDLFGTSNTSKAARILATHFDAATTADQQAGLQLAVWSALYDGGASFNANGTNFKVTNINSNALSLAGSYYSAVDATSFDKTVIRFGGQSGSGAQSQMTVVPEPFSVAALAVGLVGLARRRRR